MFFVICSISLYGNHMENYIVNFLYSKQSLDTPCFHRGFFLSFRETLQATPLPEFSVNVERAFKVSNKDINRKVS